MAHATAQQSFPWHSGEVAVQERLGVAERMAKNGSQVVRDYMPEQHRNFYNSIPFMMIGSVDESGDVWASMVTGEPGFMRSPDPRELTIDFAPDSSDPAAAGLKDGKAIGMLGIELSTRRRNRMNGLVHSTTASGFAVSVGHSFGNCPQYIQLRDFEFVRDPQADFPIEVEELSSLDDEARTMIAAADTFFVASYVDLKEERQVDVSHRGGKPGFVRVDGEGRMTIPDFAGNLHFNTLGNFTVNPRAGLIFADFETGDVLQITGDTQIVFDGPEIANFQGAERIWHFTPRRIVRRRAALPIRWKLRAGDAFSPNSLMTGSWEETAARIEAQKAAKTWREFRIETITRETAEISSFTLVPMDGGGISTFKAGQHLPVRADIPGSATPVTRTYTLSSAPSDGTYRLSVKRQGLFSEHLHSLKEGDVIEARGPGGDFFIEGDEKRPAVLVAAGVGITPMLSMLRQIVFEGKRTRGTRPTWLVHAAKSRDLRAFHDEIGELVREAAGAVKFIAVHDAPGDDEKQGEDYSWHGRFRAADLGRFLPFGDYDFYMCGPPGFMQGVYDGLRDMNVSDARIHAEAFGPSSLIRRPDEGVAVTEVVPAATESVPVIFAGSNKEARWEPQGGTLLELAEARGIEAPFSCRRGTCGMCAVKLLKGKVAYTNKPSVEVAEGEVLTCSAVPHRDVDKLEIEL
ncbi:Pyridoxamine 5'-phosphate oxidase-like, FMN-binding [Erythrobacter sp. NAP1]|uniref:2Fe-2S iron-sulfur cluster-binding protein n=1 Tax=Erythrobacter sp. NAP1 TaxID=237727 RepID=UPI0000685196|nr:pyridoxamine 5'-phosphate oxidase family protein [Erythrobacter sp. NAP1]EAQ27675.1 Pyridoxamine 5'-phosphate oxidase-like, FMN-binding [Erythrobacter sp. NAP1]